MVSLSCRWNPFKLVSPTSSSPDDGWGMNSCVAKCAESLGPAVADHVKRASQVSSTLELELRAGARSRIRWRRIGDKIGKRDGGGCGDVKAVGICARKAGSSSDKIGGVMKLTIVATVSI